MGTDKNKTIDKKRFNALFQRGTELLRRGETTKAAKLLQRAYDLDANHAELAINLGGAYILSKKFKKAVQILEPFRQSDPDHVMIWTNLGAAYLGNPVLANDEEQMRAINAFKQALALNPNAPNVAYNIGLIYRDRQEYKSAIQWFERALHTNPNDKDAQTIMERLQKRLSH